MSGKPPAHEFGKRRPIVQPSPQPQAKRSNHVALLVMGTLAVGGGAYALMPGESCVSPAPLAPGMAAPALPQTTPCTSRSSSYGGSSAGGSGRSWSFSGRESATSESSGGVTRGGFGAMAHAFAFGGG